MKREKPDQFHFKKFSVTHKRSSMKVGTDGVLLGAWVDVANVSGILDIGTGTGVIALMLAQRTPSSAQIDAVELNPEACLDAQQNFAQSPWPDRLHLYTQAIQAFAPGKTYDLIVSNPPYFVNSYKPPGITRQVARHADALTFQDILAVSKNWLANPGRMAVILPVQEGSRFMAQAAHHGFWCIRQCHFKTRPHKPAERLLLEFARTRHEKTEEHLTLYQDVTGEEWSAGYRELTRHFYLNI
jgi:tRNA1Val (adenine37-N6)-methyltransferase